MIELRMEEKFRNIGQAFRNFDRDDDSKITFDEFSQGLVHAGISMNIQTCKEIFDYLDENKDQIIEFNEFCDFFETFQDCKGNYQKISKNETQNSILESIRKQKGSISRIVNIHITALRAVSPIRFASTNIFGIANSGMSNPIKKKLSNNIQNAFSLCKLAFYIKAPRLNFR